jgi:site-specific DNA-methyltransferase (adenine-specific)
LWKHYKRIIKDNGAIVLTASQPFTTDLINSNRKMFRYDLIYEKTLGSGFLNAKRMPMRYHEEVLIFYKSIPKYNPIMGRGINKKGIRKHDSNGENYGAKTNKNQVYDDKGTRYPKSIIKFKTGNRTTGQYHPTQKPVALFEYLIKTYTNEGDLVLDNCAGSCTTAVAAYNTNRDWICIEQEEKYCAIGRERYEKHTAQLKLF